MCAAQLYGFYFRNFDPLPVTLWTTMKHGIRQQQYAISASFCTGGNGINFHRANALWQIIRNPTETTTELAIAATSNYFDLYHRDMMQTTLWDEQLRPDYEPKHKKGFAGRRVPLSDRDAFADNDDFVPFLMDDPPTAYPNYPDIPTQPFDDLTFDVMMMLSPSDAA